MSQPHMHVLADRAHPFDARGIAKRDRYGEAVSLGYRQREPGMIVIDFVVA